MPTWDEVMTTPPAGRRCLLRLLSALLAVLAVCAALWPFAIQWASGARLSLEAAAATAAHVPATAADRHDLKAARVYNARLAHSGQPRLGASISRTGGSPDFSGSSDRVYMDTLPDVMATISYPSLGIRLPVRHGASDETLRRGAGHLYGSSLPVGGKGSHTVLTGHTGLPDSLLFTRLDEARRGDVFYIAVRGTTLAYRIDRIRVVGPSDTSALRVRAGEDRATLVTCTPYGVNSHRLLVSGVRARMPEQAPYPKDARGDIKGRAMAVGAVAIGLGLPVAARMSRRPRPCRHRKPA